MTVEGTSPQKSERSAIIDRAVEAGERQGSRESHTDLREFLSRYYRHVPLDALAARPGVDLAGAALSHRQLAAQRAAGAVAVRTFTPTVEHNAWATGANARTVIEIVSDDMPFLVDSVIAELNRQNQGIHLLIHPIFVVRRSVTGDLQEINCGTAGEVFETPESLAHDELIESWIHVEIDRQTDPERLDEITRALSLVLGDVRVAVEDWPRMMDRVNEIDIELKDSPPVGIDQTEVDQTRQLLQWLAAGNFTFLGYREYHLEGTPGEEMLAAQPGSGLGILRFDAAASSGFDRLNTVARAKAREHSLLVITKANSRATVHRNVYLDYIGIKTFDASGEVVGERRFLGLFASSAYTESVRRIPVVNTKVDEVLARSGFSEESHSGKDLAQILETYPRDELFDIDVDDLAEISRGVMDMQHSRRTRLFLRTDAYGRYVSALVYLPRDRYTTTVRLRIADVLQQAFNATTLDYTARVSESALARLHFVLRVDPSVPIPTVDSADLEARLVEATRAWNEDLGEALIADAGEERAAELTRTWLWAFPEAYKEDFEARVAVADLRRIEQLESGTADADRDRVTDLNLYAPVGAPTNTRRLKLYRLAPLSLTNVLPYLANLGVEVIDERPYMFEREDAPPAYIYDFGLRYAEDVPDPDGARDKFAAAFTAAWRGQAESDGFDRLVLLARLDWRQVVVLRAYAKYLRQTGSTFSQDYVERTLRSNVAITRSLVELFEARFDPAAFDGAGPQDAVRVEACKALEQQVLTQLDQVASLDHDRILRALLGMIVATLRTNAFQPDLDGNLKDYVSFKMDPKKVPDLPAPRPAYEVFVYSPRVEGVHLRFGKVARGGLRWSDRPEDFRTEILGLVKAQMVKNALIVPTGAKGGFVAKHLPDPAQDREGWLKEGIACYRIFISGLLDLTDDLATSVDDAGAISSTVVPPAQVLRHDGEDTYLVVAADKGTATFSDIANALAQEHGFWLGDAFASGGSVGYDHKAMGITAKGAWESVRRHFREMGVDTQQDDFTVVGVGDMSGDVFGNGMLLSEHIRLLAAFDHRHIFLDPDPDAATSFAERQRMFNLERSSWADYDTSIISTGGGIHPRSAKSVPITPQVALALGIADDVTAMTPTELMTAILKAPADLLWNGGIGTYVKSRGESNADVADKANDAIRINGAQLRVRVVGEGGNLGFTQLGRVEAAMNGVRINTDAIDNSAGVDCSDHEVNIKIMLDRIVAAGDLTLKQRNGLLADMTDEVSHLVLRDNYEQNVLLGNSRKQSHSMLTVHQRFMRALEARGLLDRSLEFLPDDASIAERDAAGLGLTSPEFSVLIAYSKIALKQDLLASSLPEDPWFSRTLEDYFPHQLSERFRDRLATHPLNRELIVTCVVNELVNRGGITFSFRCWEETGASAEQIARAFTVCREIFGLRSFVAAVEELDNKVSTDLQTDVYLAFRRAMDRSVRWFLQARPETIDVGAEIARFGPVIEQLGPQLVDLAVGSEREVLLSDMRMYEERGLPSELARRVSLLLNEFQLLYITEIAERLQLEPAEVAPVYTMVSERFGVDDLLTQISALSRGDRWSALARASLRYDVYGALELITTAVLTWPNVPADADPAERIRLWESANSAAVERTISTLQEIRALESTDLASLSVALRGMRGVVRSGG